MSISDVKKILKTMRKHNRRAIVLPALLDVDGELVSCTAYDMSLGGMRLKVDVPIAGNSNVIIKIKNKLNQVAKGVWAAEGFVGLNFTDNPKTIKAGLGTLATNLN